MVTDRMTRYLSREHEDCAIAIQEFRDALRQRVALPHAERINTRLTDLTDRYTIWAVNVGVAQSGSDYKRSLDYRLRDAETYKQTVARILQRITRVCRNAREALNDNDNDSHVTPSRVGEDRDDHVEEDLTSNSSGWSLSSSDEIQHDAPPSRTGIWITSAADSYELEQHLISLDLAISSLYKIPIRKPVSAGRITLAENRLWPESAFYERFDIQFVTDLYPAASVELQQRLGKLITARRRAIHFRRRRNEDLQRATIGSLIRKPPATQATATLDLDQAIDNLPAAPQAPSMWETFEQSVKATTFKPGNLTQDPLFYLQDSISDTISESSYATTHAAKDFLDFPSRPKRPDGTERDTFECPYCLTAVQISSRRRWEKHVLSDLEPYVCLCINCGASDNLYSDREEWFQHQEQHYWTWRCGSINHTPYEHYEHFTKHLESEHGLPQASLEHTNVEQLYRVPRDPSTLTCQICQQPSKDLRKHVARHLERIALFALPREPKSEEFDGESEATHAARRSRTTLSHQYEDDLPFDSKSSSASDEQRAKTFRRDSEVRLDEEHRTSEMDDSSNCVVPDTNDETWAMIKPVLTSAPEAEMTNRDFTEEVAQSEKTESSSGPKDFQTQTIDFEEALIDIHCTWTKYFGLGDDDIAGKSSVELGVYHIIFEIVQTEHAYIKDLHMYSSIYGKAVHIYDSRRARSEVEGHATSWFTITDEVKNLAYEYLGAQLLKRLKEAGPFVIVVSDVYRDWLRQSRQAMITYAQLYHKSDANIRRRANSDPKFAQLLDALRSHPSLNRHDWQHYLKLPLSRLQRHGLLLETTQKELRKFCDDWRLTDLGFAIDDLKGVVHEIDEILSRGDMREQLNSLSENLIFGRADQIALDLESEQRKILRRDDLERDARSRLRLRKVSTHVILLDNFLLLTRARKDKERLSYEVNIVPIPLELLRSADHDTKSFKLACTGRDEEYVVHTKDIEQKQSWLDSFDRAKLERLVICRANEPYQLCPVVAIRGSLPNTQLNVPINLVSETALNMACDKPEPLSYDCSWRGTVIITCIATSNGQSDTRAESDRLTIVSTNLATLAVTAHGLKELDHASMRQICIPNGSDLLVYLYEGKVWPVSIGSRPMTPLKISDVTCINCHKISDYPGRWGVIEPEYIILAANRNTFYRIDYAHRTNQTFERHLRIPVHASHIAPSEEGSTLSNLNYAITSKNECGVVAFLPGVRDITYIQRSSFPDFPDTRGRCLLYLGSLAKQELAVFEEGAYRIETYSVISYKRFRSKCRKVFLTKLSSRGTYLLVGVFTNYIEVFRLGSGRSLQIIEGEDIDAWPSSAEKTTFTTAGLDFMISLRDPRNRGHLLVLHATLKDEYLRTVIE